MARYTPLMDGGSDDLLADKGTRTYQECLTWLGDLLWQYSECMPAGMIKKLAEWDGFTPNQLERARRAITISTWTEEHKTCWYLTEAEQFRRVYG